MLLALSPEGPTATPRRPSSPSASFMSAGTLAEINPAEATIIPGGGDDDDSKLRNQHMPALPPLLPSPTDRLYRIHLRQQRSTDGDKGASDSDGLELPPPLSPQDGSDLLGLQQELATIRQENHRLRNDLSQLIEIHKQQQSMVMAYESTLAKALQALRANIASQGDRIGEVRDHYIGRINEESRAMSQLQAENQALRTKLVEAASAIRLSLEFSSGNSGGESERLVGDGG
ncbi:hypothetical protein EV182_006842 [Spiromyces aspiralis]|uniref:Uncharacterized protein n=1 Tax=Spiromyces aspiralis TaxID=68401 RepID=A0ACC1HM76_9FUNG|nr:hypothetical protein EV182_006842 [Spiromyces aspiralis]